MNGDDTVAKLRCDIEGEKNKMRSFATKKRSKNISEKVITVKNKKSSGCFFLFLCFLFVVVFILFIWSEMQKL